MIAMLDRHLAMYGEDITLRRVTGVRPQVFSDVTVRAAVKRIQVKDLVTGGDLAQEHLEVIISPTQIDTAQWPGGVPVGGTIDPRVPVAATDKLVIRERVRQVQNVDAKYRDDVLVRVDMVVEGG